MHEVILVVDDEDSVRIMFARLLRMQGYQVVQAASASQALALLAEEEPDLVISDVVMPGETRAQLPLGVTHRIAIWGVFHISQYRQANDVGAAPGAGRPCTPACHFPAISLQIRI